MSSLEIQQVLAEMRALKTRASGHSSDAPTGVGGPPANAQAPDFAALLKGSINRIAEMQNQAVAMSEAYESGDKSVDLTKVMLEVQKAGLAFHAMTEVRNKLLDAYTQVMSMSV